MQRCGVFCIRKSFKIWAYVLLISVTAMISLVLYFHTIQRSDAYFKSSKRLLHLDNDTKTIKNVHSGQDVFEHNFHFNANSAKQSLPKSSHREELAPKLQTKDKELEIDQSLPRILNGSFVPKHYLYDREAYLKYKEYINKVEPPLPLQTKAVIILTNYRSGSSFFGQLFNHHPDVFYFFEPLYPITHSDVCEQINAKNFVLSELIQCKLPNYRNLFSNIPLQQRIPRTIHLKRCLINNVCFQDSTLELCSERHCPTSRKQKSGDCFANCGVVNPVLAMNDCRSKKMVAMKIIRYCDISYLKDIFENTNVDVKVLHLIRDPRGIANSRRYLHRRMNLRESLQLTCARQSQNVHSAMFSPPDWLKGKYQVFRYEDAALYPYETAKSVYEFLGLSFPDSTKDWIATNTGVEYRNQEILTTPKTIHDDEREKRDVELQAGQFVADNDKTLRQKRGPYGTTRNSTAVAQRWAKRLPYSLVKEIESVCLDIMKLMGYKRISDAQYMQKDSNVRYFSDRKDILLH